MKILVTDIQWDTEVDGEIVLQENLGLPSSVVIDEEIDSRWIPDFLSDKYGYCILSYGSCYELADTTPQVKFIIMYCYERDMSLLGKAATYDEALEIMKTDFFKVFDDQVGTREGFENEDGLNDTWWFAGEIGEAWINGKGHHDWVIVDISEKKENV